MNGQRLYSIEDRQMSALADVHVVAESLNADYRYVVWSGIPPTDRLAHEKVAPIAWVGTASGRPVYLERVPAGTPWSALAPDSALCTHVAGQIMRILADLHAANRVHGSISADRVWISTHGEVSLIGTGRIVAPPSFDLLRAWGLSGSLADTTLPTDNASDAALMLLASTTGDEPARLARHAAAATAEAKQGSALDIEVREDGIDEVVPDIGPDAAQDGLLDRWHGTTGGRSGDTTGRVDATVGAVVRTAAFPLSLIAAHDDTTGAAPLNLAGIVVPPTMTMAPTVHEEVTAVEGRRPAISSRRWMELVAAMGVGALLMWLWTAWYGR
jgi:hypothetical protein